MHDGRRFRGARGRPHTLDSRFVRGQTTPCATAAEKAMIITIITVLSPGFRLQRPGCRRSDDDDLSSIGMMIDDG